MEYQSVTIIGNNINILVCTARFFSISTEFALAWLLQFLNRKFVLFFGYVLVVVLSEFDAHIYSVFWSQRECVRKSYWLITIQHKTHMDHSGTVQFRRHGRLVLLY